MAKEKRAPFYRTTGRFGIMNHVGSIWTPETFCTESRAKKYIEQQSEQNPTWKLNRHRVVPVRVTVTALAK